MYIDMVSLVESKVVPKYTLHNRPEERNRLQFANILILGYRTFPEPSTRRLSFDLNVSITSAASRDSGCTYRACRTQTCVTDPTGLPVHDTSSAAVRKVLDNILGVVEPSELSSW